MLAFTKIKSAASGRPGHMQTHTGIDMQRYAHMHMQSHRHTRTWAITTHGSHCPCMHSPSLPFFQLLNLFWHWRHREVSVVKWSPYMHVDHTYKLHTHFCLTRTCAYIDLLVYATSVWCVTHCNCTVVSVCCVDHLLVLLWVTQARRREECVPCSCAESKYTETLQHLLFTGRTGKRNISTICTIKQSVLIGYERLPNSQCYSKM